MPCGNKVLFEQFRALEQRIKLHKSVTVDTRIRRLTVDVRTVEPVDHTFLETVTELIDIMRKSELCRNEARIFYII